MWLFAALTAVVALSASIRGLPNDFANDDASLIEENPRVHDLGRVGEWFTKPYWPPPFDETLYRPLTTATHAVEFALGSGQPLVFRLVSYLMYAVAAVGVFLLAAMLLPQTIALAIASLFAAHPVHVEAVALAVGQAELMVGLLSLAAVLLYLRRRRSNGLRTRDWIALGALYGAACLFKETGFVLPGLLVAAELFLVEGAVRPRVRALARGFGALAFVGIALLAVRAAVLSSFAGTTVAEAITGTTVAGRSLTMMRVAGEWFRLMVWPAHLRADYSPQEFVASTSFGRAEAWGLSLVILTLLLAWRARRRLPVVSFGIAWFAIGIFPVSNILLPTGVLIAERTLFLPSIGFVIALGGLAAYALEHVRIRPHRQLVGAIVSGLVIVGVIRSASRQHAWLNDGMLSLRTVMESPRSSRAQAAYGNTLFWVDRPDLALEAYAKALALAPASEVWRIRNNLARHYHDVGEFGQARLQLQASLNEMPSQQDTRAYLVTTLIRLGYYNKARNEAAVAMGMGGLSHIFSQLEQVADSAQRAKAPAGSVVIELNTDDFR